MHEFFSAVVVFESTSYNWKVRNVDVIMFVNMFGMYGCIYALVYGDLQVSASVSLLPISFLSFTPLLTTSYYSLLKGLITTNNNCSFCLSAKQFA